MRRSNQTKHRKSKPYLRFDMVKRIKTDPESSLRERVRESFSERLQRRGQVKNLLKMTDRVFGHGLTTADIDACDPDRRRT